jgi:xanthine/uracil/vitamin C permease (AzgA family)
MTIAIYAFCCFLAFAAGILCAVGAFAVLLIVSAYRTTDIRDIDDTDLEDYRQ